MTEFDGDDADEQLGRVGRWWRQLMAPLREPPSLKRRIYAACLDLFACTAVLFVAAVVTGSKPVFVVTQLAHGATVACFTLYLAILVKADRRRWAEASQPSLDLALIGDEPDVIVRKWPFLFRACFVVAGVFFVALAFKAAFETSLAGWQAFFVLPFLGLGAWLASFARFMLVVTRDLVAVRTNMQWRTAAWGEVQAVEPSHNGFVFELKDGRRLVAVVTAKTQLTFLAPRYDKALLENLRARIR